MGKLQYQAYKDQKLSWNSIEYKEVFWKEKKKKMKVTFSEDCDFLTCSLTLRTIR